VSGIVTANPERTANGAPRAGREKVASRPRRGGWPLGSRVGRLIVILNLLGLAILIGGALVLNELRRGLVDASIDSLSLEGHVIANVIDQDATVGDPEPALEADAASNVLQALPIPRSQRARLYDAEGHLLADSFVVADRVETSGLPPARKPGDHGFHFGLGTVSPGRRVAAAQAALHDELARALSGETVSGTRVSEAGHKIVSVSIPIQHVRAVLGVLTLEAGDVDQIITAERLALLPFILIAVGVNLLSSLLLTQLVATPVLRLARAADRVRLSRARAIALPDLANRGDELGDLARSLEEMTQALSERMDSIERFAADVAHELRNPMTSIRSAVETLDLVKDAAPRQRLLAILQQDVGRLERLITDISNASRLDAELGREAPRPLDAVRLLSEICMLYEATAKPGDVSVQFVERGAGEPLRVSAREGPLGQVVRNLIDNARSFSPTGAAVRVAAWRVRDEVVMQVDDDGPGIPPENLETIFQRFYTSRPKGAAFGGNSGLGLAIARQIVEVHGGRIWAENREAEGRIVGARFVVALPAA
jgi:two-component system sensor histidine kinase ChvG